MESRRGLLSVAPSAAQVRCHPHSPSLPTAPLRSCVRARAVLLHAEATCLTGVVQCSACSHSLELNA
jgi:hypothetical protein